METFAEPRPLVADPGFGARRATVLNGIQWERIDTPIQDIVKGLSKIESCFTLQACFGHFVHGEQPSPENLIPLPSHDVGAVTYRIAYVAFCVEDSGGGSRLLSSLAEVPRIDPEYVQFGSPEWFWDQHVNSFALQVEPSRFKDQDQATIDHAEAVHVQHVRDQFFTELRRIAGDRADKCNLH